MNELKKSKLDALRAKLANSSLASGQTAAIRGGNAMLQGNRPPWPPQPNPTPGEG